uniref:Uncharacterized protein n=1 Tax=Leersia perrieri TaxID=77586 RepID=A0A0D9V378_9ORYZ
MAYAECSLFYGVPTEALFGKAWNGPERPLFRPKRSDPFSNLTWPGSIIRFGLPGLETGPFWPSSSCSKPGSNPHLLPSGSNPDGTRAAGDAGRRRGRRRTDVVDDDDLFPSSVRALRCLLADWSISFDFVEEQGHGNGGCWN